MRMTAMKKRNKKREQGEKIPAAPLLAAVLVLSGCSAGGNSPASESSFEEPERTAETLLEISDPAEKAAVEAAKARVAAMTGNPGSLPPLPPQRRSVTGWIWILWVSAAVLFPIFRSSIRICPG